MISTDCGAPSPPAAAGAHSGPAPPLLPLPAVPRRRLLPPRPHSRSSLEAAAAAREAGQGGGAGQGSAGQGRAGGSPLPPPAPLPFAASPSGRAGARPAALPPGGGTHLPGMVTAGY